MLKISKLQIVAYVSVQFSGGSSVWHANINIGTTDVRVINFPTQPYDHDNPDKLRQPIDTPLIPYQLPDSVVGW